MKLIIAEKDEVAKAIAEALGGGDKTNGYYQAGEYTITAASGHLLRLFEPQEYNPALEKWNLDDLPMSFIPWQRTLTDRGKRQYDIMLPLLKQATEIIHAGDPDEEGQFIVDSILAHAGIKNIPIKRALINDNSKKAILRELAEAEDNEKFIGLGKAADARAVADQLFGYNMTRVYTLLARKQGYPEVLNVGRVKTPVLGLVVRRDEEVEGHVPSFYYPVYGLFCIDGVNVSATYKTCSKDPVDEKKRISEEDAAKAIAEAIKDKKGQIIAVETKHHIVSPPLPYNLLKLQADAAQQLKLRPVQVKDITQRLREHKLITYNRSDSQYLKEDRHGDAPDVMAAIFANVTNLQALINQTDTDIKSKAFNSSKVTAHHAIIPTETVVDFNILKDDERKIYELIAKAYCLQFMQNHEYDRTDILIEVDGKQFTCWSKIITVTGWKSFVGKTDTDEEGFTEEDFSKFRKNMNADCISGEYQKKKTKPKSRYTLSTLLMDLTSVAKYIKDSHLRALLIAKDKEKEGEHGGIGTPATRDDIIQSLFDSGFLQAENEGNMIRSTQKGREFYDILPPWVTFPDMTAQWADMQRQIATGELTQTVFIGNVMASITQEIARVKEEKIKLSGMYECPKCRSAIRRLQNKDKTGFFWGCTKYPDCTNTVPDKNGKPDYTAQSAQKSELSEHKCKACGLPLRKLSFQDKSFWGCSGYKKDENTCKQTYPDDKGKPDFNPKSQPSSIHNCMKCNRQLRLIKGSPDFWSCTGYSKKECNQTYQNLDGKPDYNKK